jgi:hypothetical protein
MKVLRTRQRNRSQRSSSGASACASRPVSARNDSTSGGSQPISGGRRMYMIAMPSTPYSAISRRIESTFARDSG